MATSVDPDQTFQKEQSDLFASAVLSETLVYEILRHLLYVNMPMPKIKSYPAIARKESTVNLQN